jgi:hypothetical protein
VYWYSKSKEEAQDRTQFGRGYEHVARQTATWTWIFSLKAHMYVSDSDILI